MERKHKRLVWLGASVCVLAILAVTMFLGASRTGYFGPENSIYPGKGQRPSSNLLSEPGKFQSFPNIKKKKEIAFHKPFSNFLLFYNAYFSDHSHSMHHERVKIARRKCPRYQDMDGNCLGIY